MSKLHILTWPFSKIEGENFNPTVVGFWRCYLRRWHPKGFVVPRGVREMVGRVVEAYGMSQLEWSRSKSSIVEGGWSKSPSKEANPIPLSNSTHSIGSRSLLLLPQFSQFLVQNPLISPWFSWFDFFSLLCFLVVVILVIADLTSDRLW